VGEERHVVAFRFAMHDLVYLAGSTQPYEVLGQMYLTMALSGEERRYYLRSSLGDTCWIDERHVFAKPTRQVPA
jgi:hypothetical protein